MVDPNHPGPRASNPLAADASSPFAPDDSGVGVYLHVPFCERVCPYCDFAVVATRVLARDAEERYVAALETELVRRTAPAAVRSRLASVYLGGGTPSLLRPDSVARLVAACRGAFGDARDAEVTLEVNPSTLERERLPGFREAGVNRLSIGVQSFDDALLRRLGRAHRAEEAHRTLLAARAAGFGNVSLDLIFAAPGEDEATLERDLDATIAFGPEHVSTYALTVEEGTPFALAERRGQLRLPDEELAARMMERVEARLEAAGVARYELSSFARPGAASRHNRRYWERRSVLGLGVGAWSCEAPSAGAPHGARRVNVRALPAYLAAIESGGLADAAPREVLSPATARGEAMFLALRTSAGLRAGAFAAEFGAPPRSFFDADLARLVPGGLLEENAAGDLRLTARGRLLADSVFACFVAGACG